MFLLIAGYILIGMAYASVSIIRPSALSPTDGGFETLILAALVTTLWPVAILCDLITWIVEV